MKRTFIAFFAAALLLPLSANADFISGDINITGTLTFSGGDGSLSEADTLSFEDAIVANSSGTYAPLPNGEVVDTFNDLVIDPFNPVNPLWEIVAGGVTYAFNLANITVDTQTDWFIVIYGFGTATVTGYDPAPMQWVFTGNNLGQGSFSSSHIVPEPGTLALLGLGLLGLGLRRRRQQQT